MTSILTRAAVAAMLALVAGGCSSIPIPSTPGPAVEISARGECERSSGVWREALGKCEIEAMN